MSVGGGSTCPAARPGGKHWWIAVLEADDPGGLAGCEARVAFAVDEQTCVKDPVIHQGPGGWRAWICAHPLEEKGEEDRMSTAYATERGRAKVALARHRVCRAPRDVGRALGAPRPAVRGRCTTGRHDRPGFVARWWIVLMCALATFVSARSLPRLCPAGGSP